MRTLSHITDDDTRLIANHLAANITVEMNEMTGAPMHAPPTFTQGLAAHLVAWLNNKRMDDWADTHIFLHAMAQGCKRFEEHGDYSRFQCPICCEDGHE